MEKNDQEEIYKARIEQLERENQLLKKSIYDLTNRICLLLSQNPTQKSYYSFPSTSPTSTFNSQNALGIQQQQQQQSGEEIKAAEEGENNILGKMRDFLFESGEDEKWSGNRRKRLPLFLDTASGPTSPIEKMEEQTPNTPQLGHERVVGIKEKIIIDCGSQSAFYCCQFQGDAGFLAAGSFDSTIRILKDQQEFLVLRGHQLSVCDLQFQEMKLISASFDGTCKLWDLSNGACLQSLDCEGFVQTVSLSPAQPNLTCFGTSRKVLGILDWRQEKTTQDIHLDAMINSTYFSRDGQWLMSADSLGQIKKWDVRYLRNPSMVLYQSSSKCSITCMNVCEDLFQPDSLIYSFNSYDHVIRVGGVVNGKESQQQLQILSQLTGIQNKNWPIKSSQYFPFIKYPSMPISGFLVSGSADGQCYVYSLSSGLRKFKRLLLAHSSTSNRTSISSPVTEQPIFSTGATNSPLITEEIVVNEEMIPNWQIMTQNTNSSIAGGVKLEAHKERCYAASFHPNGSFFSSVGGDGKIIYWPLSFT